MCIEHKYRSSPADISKGIEFFGRMSRIRRNSPPVMEKVFGEEGLPGANKNKR